MTLHEFPRLGERYWEQRLENGLLLRVVPKPGFARSYAFLGVDYGSVDTSFTRGGIPCRTPDGVAHYLEHKMFDLPEDCQTSVYSTPTRAYTKPRATPVISSCRIVSSIAFLPFLLM